MWGEGVWWWETGSRQAGRSKKPRSRQGKRNPGRKPPPPPSSQHGIANSSSNHVSATKVYYTEQAAFQVVKASVHLFLLLGAMLPFKPLRPQPPWRCCHRRECNDFSLTCGPLFLDTLVPGARTRQETLDEYRLSFAQLPSASLALRL